MIWQRLNRPTNTMSINKPKVHDGFQIILEILNKTTILLDITAFLVKISQADHMKMVTNVDLLLREMRYFCL